MVLLRQNKMIKLPGMKQLAALLLALSLLLIHPAQAAAAVSCAWAPLDNPSNPYNGRPFFCPTGFTSPSDATSHRVGFGCADNCGPGGGGITQYADIDTGSVVVGSNGQIEQVACFGGDIDQSVYDRVHWCVDNSPVATCIGAATIGAAVTFLSGGSAVGILAWSAGTCAAAGIGSAVAQEALNNCAVTFRGVVVDSSGREVCSADFVYRSEIALQDEADTSYRRHLCNQIPEAPRREKCMTCQSRGSGAIWTAVGCIPANATAIVQSIVKVGLGIAGGVALLMILAAGFMFSTSQGDPKRTGEARELITSAVIGLLFIIFSITILQFIGVTIFRIPGFGTTTSSGNFGGASNLNR
jgi:hypothetical protein